MASVSVNVRVRRLDSVATNHIGVPALRGAGAAGAGAEARALDLVVARQRAAKSTVIAT